jgi:UDP-2,3-diacylglucosamine pyrophosphatase LpxH
MNAPIIPGTRPLYRSVFVSDTHLGTRGARCDFLANFLHRVSCQKLFLVGDIFDGWRLRKSWYWDEHHDEVLRQILRHARGGARSPFGNHDEMFRAGWICVPGAWKLPASAAPGKPST